MNEKIGNNIDGASLAPRMIGDKVISYDVVAPSASLSKDKEIPSKLYLYFEQVFEACKKIDKKITHSVVRSAIEKFISDNSKYGMLYACDYVSSSLQQYSIEQAININPSEIVYNLELDCYDDEKVSFNVTGIVNEDIICRLSTDRLFACGLVGDGKLIVTKLTMSMRKCGCGNDDGNGCTKQEIYIVQVKRAVGCVNDNVIKYLDKMRKVAGVIDRGINSRKRSMQDRRALPKFLK